ncbi:asparagine synthase-related protein [Micromonospora rubida]|uniref:asparagine synthase-related protein n=1 Tax=Micromonospora rubida TaxID=2697657 RepID=UPI0013778B86|nr:asparagine synthase-related protein [Micromonospora rubida]NBE85368.1 hypothetical protein [Micromonospora rubida]
MLRPTSLDLASGTVLGVGPPVSLILPPCLPTPLVALEQAVLPALCRPPCVVSFSGGLDSSVVLAIAVNVARAHGLPDPVPVTWRFTGAPRADESSWQERVISALAVGRSWQILRADDDLDLIGPVARRLLNRHGVLHPVNLHLHLPIVELAAGGSLLTGLGGDQILAGWRRPAPASWRARLAGTRQRALIALRRPQRPTEMFPWLRPEAARKVHRAYRAEQEHEPRRLGPRIDWHTRRRDLSMTCSAFEQVADDQDVKLVQPLLDDTFLAALTRLAGNRRHTTRESLIAEITAGSLPTEATAPRRKARFLEVFLRAPTREFVQHWDGTGVDPTLVDVSALRTIWARWPIPGGTANLVQQASLASHPELTDRQHP